MEPGRVSQVTRKLAVNEKYKKKSTQVPDFKTKHEKVLLQAICHRHQTVPPKSQHEKQYYCQSIDSIVDIVTIISRSRARSTLTFLCVSKQRGRFWERRGTNCRNDGFPLHEPPLTQLYPAVKLHHHRRAGLNCWENAGAYQGWLFVVFTYAELFVTHLRVRQSWCSTD